ncbi:SDR family oxidoreductase [Actinomadura formosensis]|uniref:SDR family oxidoreductase n=1 Tax=Actinomadura formosensis TaxID=60706 RepID=UPI003D8F2A96
MTDLGLDGRVALVTGGTRGLGLAIARRLCAAGCHVHLNYAADDAAAEAAVKSLAGLRGTASAMRADIRSPAAPAEMIGRVAERHGRLDVFVHNTSALRPMTAADADCQGLRDVQSVVVEPLARAVPALAGAMRAGGRVVAVSSVGARRVVPRYMSLGIAKAALESLVRYLAVELAGDGIAVNAVSTSKLDKGAPDEAARALARRTPAGRLTRPEDVADVVALLCTAEAAWIRGQVITADGGLTLHA